MDFDGFVLIWMDFECFLSEFCDLLLILMICVVNVDEFWLILMIFGVTWGGSGTHWG